MVDVSEGSERQDGRAGAALRIEPVHWDGQGRVAMVGEIDLANVGEAEAVLVPLAEQGIPLILDVVGLTFCDSQGVAMLFRLSRIAQEHGGSLAIANPQGGVRRILELTRVADAVSIIVDL